MTGISKEETAGTVVTGKNSSTLAQPAPVVGNRPLRQIMAAYGIEYSCSLPPQKGYRNTSTPVVLKNGKILNLIIYKNEPGILAKIQEANRIADTLAARGFPARYTYSSKIIVVKGRASQTKRYGAVYDYLPGSTIPWEAYTRTHLKLLGKTMSDMHVLLEDEVAAADCTDEYYAILARMKRYFADENVRRAMASKLQLTLPDTSFKRCEKALRASRLLPRQALHMDFVRGNILFGGADEPYVSGVIDFEKVATGPRILDIARTLAFLLVDCKYKSEKDIRKAFVYSGYLKRGAASFQTVRHGGFDLLEELLDLFLLHDFYKFLRHNPYESLPQNEHFVRTRDLLQKRQHLMDMNQGPRIV